MGLRCLASTAWHPPCRASAAHDRQRIPCNSGLAGASQASRKARPALDYGADLSSLRRASDRATISDHAAKPSPKAPACSTLRGSKYPTHESSA